MPKLECDSSATFGVEAEAPDLLGRQQRDLGELLGGRIGVDVGVADEQRVRCGSISTFIAA